MDGTLLTSHAASVTRLADRWLAAVAVDPSVREAGGDFACSPTGLWIALASISAGARGATANELRALLDTSGPEAASVVTDALRSLQETDALAVATGVWTRVPVDARLRESLPDVGFGALRPVVSPPVDAWVREATGGLVEELPLDLSPGAALLLVNALALKVRWADPFDPSETRDRPFTDAAGEAHRVPTMHKQFPAAAAWTVGDTRVVELRCATHGALEPARVRFVLGPPGAPPDDVLPATWAPAASRSPIDADTVGVALPRLALRTRLAVTGHAGVLGLGRSLSDAADFSGLSPEPLAVDEMVQEAMISVGEKGVEAAAVTTVTMRTMAFVRSRVERIAFDRPFGVVLLDGTGKVPLFTAWQASRPVFAR